MSEPDAVEKICNPSVSPSLEGLAPGEFLSGFSETVRSLLNARQPLRLRDARETHRRAGVLIPLVEEQSGLAVILTRRTHLVPHHKGQISFPGGKFEARDGSAWRTALREAYEEIGLCPEDVVPLGRMDDTLTLVSRFVVHPFVGLVPPSYPFRLNPQEVAALVKVPLEVFHPAQTGYRCDSVEYEGEVYRTRAYAYEGDVIWGATARIMDNFMRIVACKLGLPLENR